MYRIERQHLRSWKGDTSIKVIKHTNYLFAIIIKTFLSLITSETNINIIKN